MFPLLAMDSPSGALAGETLYVYGGVPPWALSRALYGCPAVACGNVGLARVVAADTVVAPMDASISNVVNKIALWGSKSLTGFTELGVFISTIGVLVRQDRFKFRAVSNLGPPLLVPVRCQPH